MLLLTLLVLLRASNAEKRSATKTPTRTAEPDFYEELLPETSAQPRAQAYAPVAAPAPVRFPRADMTPAEKQAYVSQLRRMRQQPTEAESYDPFTIKPLSLSRPNAYAPRSYAGAAPYSPSGSSSRSASASRPASTGGRPYASGSSGSNNNAPAARRDPRQSAREETAAEARGRMFSPYTPPAGRAQQERVKQQLAGVSSGVEQAIAKALAPKSKQQANIEKYLQRRRQKDAGASEGVAQGPFAGVVEQVAAQKNDVVGGISDAYGESAGAKAAGIMDNFQNELKSAVSKPGQTSEQIAKKTRDINAKYSRQLQDLQQREGLSKVEADQRQENEKYLAQLKEKYSPETVEAARAKFDAFTKQKMELVKQQLPEDQLYEKLLPMQRKLDDDLKNVIVEKNPKMAEPLKPWNDIQNKVNMEKVAEQKKAVEEGRAAPRAFRPDEQTVKQFDKDLTDENNKRLESIEKSYGPQAAAEAKVLLENYKKAQMEALQSQEDVSVINEKRQAEAEKASKELNALLQRRAGDRVKQVEAEVKQSNQKYIDEVMKSEQMQKLPPEQRDMWKKEAQPILDQMAREIAALSNQNLSAEEMQKQQQAAQERAQQKMAAIGQNAAGAAAQAASAQDPAQREAAAKQVEAQARAENEKIVSDIFNQPQMKELSETQKAAAMQQVRGILDERAKKLAEAARTAKSSEELQKRAEQIGKEAQGKMEKIQIPQERPAAPGAQ